MTLDITAGVIVSFVALVFTIIYNSRSGKNNDIEQAKERAKRDERVDNKLDQIFNAISNLQTMISGMQNKMSEQDTAIKRVSHKCNTLDERITRIEKALNIQFVIDNRGVEDE